MLDLDDFGKILFQLAQYKDCCYLAQKLWVFSFLRVVQISHLLFSLPQTYTVHELEKTKSTKELLQGQMQVIILFMYFIARDMPMKQV